MINPNISDQKYFFVFPSIKKKINIAKIIINYHKLDGKTMHWTIPKTLWIKIICHISNTKRVEDEK